MASVELMKGFRFDATLGAALVGFAASSVIYGILCSQIWNYYHRYPNDRVYKALVTAVWTIETIDQALIGHSVYYYTITNFGDLFTLLLDKPNWSLIVQMILGAVTGTTVKTCFAIRVWRISAHNFVVTAFLLFLTYAGLGLAIAFAIKCFQLPSLGQLVSLRVLGSLALGFGVLTDVLIAATLCFYLQRFRNEYSRSYLRSSPTSSSDSPAAAIHSKSNQLINSLMIHVVDTGVMTSAFSLATLILYDVMPTNFIFICFYFLLSKFYATSLMAALNARKVPLTGNEARSIEPDSAIFVVRPTYSNGVGLRGVDPESPSELKIDVHQEVSVTSDLPYSSMNYYR